MCGITGIVQVQTPVSATDLRRSTDTMRHRGPDGTATWIAPDGLTGLGHSRLAFLDLSEKGTQPIGNEDGSIWLTFNGEIYNFEALREELIARGHRFISKTDSEVLVHGYEEFGIEKLLAKLNGMFAFGIWDDCKKCLILARDRFGIKPLYFLVDARQLIFGSELKAITAYPNLGLRIDPTAIFDYLTYRYIPSPKTIWQHVQKLEPAHYLIYRRGDSAVNPVRYWDVPVPEKVISVKEATELLHHQLLQSVKKHLRADVPIGAFLSGGYDSSSLVCYMKEAGYCPNTFSIGFQDWRNSEHQYAQQVARHLNVPHFNQLAGQEQLSLLQELSYFYDEPIADISIIPTYMVSQLARKYNKAVFSGEGADELLGGYWWQKDVARTPEWLTHLLPNKKKWLLEKYATAMAMGRMNEDNFGQYLSEDFLREAPLQAEWFYEKHLKNDRTPLKVFQYLDTRTFMGELVLTKIDRSTMAHSLEARVPFLDHELFETIAKLKTQSFYNKVINKLLLFKNIETKLPKAILNRPKQGFVGPDKYYMRYDWYAQHLRDGQLMKAQILTQKGLNKMLAENDHWRLWKFTVLEFWWQRWAS